MVFLALGAWSFFGALKNLRRSNREIPRLRTYAVAKANVIAICVLLPSCVLANIYKDELVRLGGVTDKFAVAICEGFGSSLVAVPFVLLAHVIAKASHRETAKSESNPSAA